MNTNYKCSPSQLIRCVPLLAASSRAGLPLRYTSHDYLYLVTLLTLPPNNKRCSIHFLSFPLPGWRLRLPSRQEGVQRFALLHRFLFLDISNSYHKHIVHNSLFSCFKHFAYVLPQFSESWITITIRSERVWRMERQLLRPEVWEYRWQL